MIEPLELRLYLSGIQVFDGVTNLPQGSGSSSIGSINTNGAVATKLFTIKNTGTTAITLQPATVTPGAGFKLLSNFGVNQSLFAGYTVTLTVQLDSSVAGNKLGVISFAASDPSSNPLTFNVTGTVTSLGTTIDNTDPGFSTTGSWANVAGYGYGGSAVALSDLLGDHNLLFSAYVNGRITEAAVNATYVNMAHRINWAVGVGQEPYYFLEASQITPDSSRPGGRVFVTNLRRIVQRSVSGQGYYPLSRFARIEFGMTAATISDKRQQILEPFDPATGRATDNPVSREVSLSGASYFQPSLAYTFDNSLPGYVGPFYGRRSRFSVAQSLGGWRFFEGLADYRRYDHIVGPFTLATRALYFGRIGRDADRFRVYLGSTDLLRGNTSGSYYRNECRTTDPGTYTGCIELDRLVGTQLAVGSAELRFPLLNSSFGFIPNGFPPIEGALFYDIGLAWNEGDKLKFNRAAGDDPIRVRTPAQTLGASARMNLFNFVVLRLDYSIPQERRSIKGYWTLSLGPVF